MSLRKSVPGSLFPVASVSLRCALIASLYVVAVGPDSPQAPPPVEYMPDPACYDAALTTDRQQRVPWPGTPQRLRAADGSRRLAELRVLCRWAHDLRNETMSTHGICRTRRTGCARPTPGLAERRPLCAVCVRGCAGA